MFPWAGVLLVLVLFTYAVTGMQVGVASSCD